MNVLPNGSADPLGHRILTLIESRNTTIAALVEATGIPSTTLRRKLDGRAHSLTVAEAAAVAKALNVKLSELVRE